MNGTVQHNVVGFSLFSQDWDDAVIHGCALNVDLCQMPARSHTLVGSRGIALSHGQKQRVADFKYLARAVYARKRFAIFDDVLSGLD
ncbi:hypothetical protein B0O99DRAFT_680141 [Bisporella sp. PMI_857]|nr:hypothetical protein B0O99DRAFT_680141 [Bisporella sp. PMI_857]